MDWNLVWSESARIARLVWGVVSSGTAQRIYVIVITVVLLFLAHKRAMKLKVELQESISSDLDEIKFRGRRPTTRAGKQKRKQQLYLKIVERVVGSWRMLAQMIFLGVALPTAALFFGTLHYNWFYAGAPALVDVATAKPVVQPSLLQLVLFTADQLLKGGLSDLMEVAKVQIATVSNNAAAYPFSVLVFAFRTYVDIFVILGFASLGRIMVNTYKILKERMDLEQPEAAAAH